MADPPNRRRADGLFVDFRKWPDRGHWHFTVYPLGEDEHGRWFVLPAGSTVQKGAEPERIYPRTSAVLLRDGDWWAAYWNEAGDEPFEVYVDVATPARWGPDRVTMVDLDLDVVRTWKGEVKIIDRDEFEAHQKLLKYPKVVIETAERTARELAAAIERRQEPFADVGAKWLREAISRHERVSPGRIDQRTETGETAMPANPPENMPRISPYLYYEDVAAALEWLARAFGLVERMRMPMPDGSIAHAEMEYADGVIMMGCPGKDYRNPKHLGGLTQGLYVYVDDVDKHFEQAKSAGAKIVEEPADQFYGDRRYGAEDLEGHHWNFAQRVRDIAPEDMKLPG